MSYANGEKYDGQWKDDKKQGRGMHSYQNGDRYDGGWIEDEECWDGESLIKFIGVYYFNNGDKYKGDWKDEKLNGEGN